MAEQKCLDLVPKLSYILSTPFLRDRYSTDWNPSSNAFHQCTKGLRCVDFGREYTNEVIVRLTISVHLSRECIVLGEPATPIQIPFLSLTECTQVLKDVYVCGLLLDAFYMTRPKLSLQIVCPVNYFSSSQLLFFSVSTFTIIAPTKHFDLLYSSKYWYYFNITPGHIHVIDYFLLFDQMLMIS